MANTLKFGNGNWAVKEGSTLAYNDENNNFKPLPFNFERDSSATVINKDGLIEEVGSGQPRVDYKDNSKGALLLEPSRSNAITNSETFGSTGWGFVTTGTVIAPIVTNDYAISPDGTQNAQRIQFDLNGGTTSSDRTVIRQSIGTQNDWFLSVWMKSTNGAEQKILWHTTADSNETIVTGEWKRFTFSRNGVSNSWVGLGLRGGTSGVDTADILVYGFQAEQGSYATSYIPTSGSAVTRVAEQGIDCGAGTPIFSNTSAVWFIDLERIGIDTDSSGSGIALRNSSFSQQIRLHFDQPSANIRFRDGVNGYATISTITGANPNVRKKLALRIDGSTLSTFSNGSKIGSDYTAPNSFNIDEVDFSSIGFKIHDMRFYNTALTDQELIALTQV